MIFVVHQPEEGHARAWFAHDDQDFLRKVCVDDPLPEWEVYDVISPRELLELADQTPEAPGARESCPAIFALADAHGWDTALYRADHLLGAGHLRPEPVDLREAAIAALTQRTGRWRIYGNEETALGAVDRPDELFDAPGGWRARWALREQLIAVEALADDN